MTKQNTAASTEKPAKAEKPKVEKVTANGVTRPKAGTKTARVWEIADKMRAEVRPGKPAVAEVKDGDKIMTPAVAEVPEKPAGTPAARKDVIAACMAEDINAATAATQYGRWRKFNGLKGSDEPAAPAAPKGEDKPAEQPSSDIQVEGEAEFK